MNLGKTMTTMRHAASQSQYQNGSSTRDKPVANRIEGRATVFSRLPGALARAALVVLLIAIPTAMLSTATADTGAFVSLVAIFAALFTLVEYTAASPSIVEFRSAPPFNRLRFGALFLTVVLLTIIAQGSEATSSISQLLQALGQRVASSIDIPYSPVRLMLLMMPQDTDPAVVDSLRVSSGISYLISLLSIVCFIILLRMRRWPKRNGTFNVWVNLPTFDPTAGGDVVDRLNRDSQVNIILGFLLPFVIPAFLKFTQVVIGPIVLDDPQTMIWMVTAWAFLPASLLMRGVALSRVAQLIYTQRKRAYEQAIADGMLPA